MGNNVALFRKQTSKEMCIKHVTASFPAHSYSLNESERTLPIGSAAAAATPSTYVHISRNKHLRNVCGKVKWGFRKQTQPLFCSRPSTARPKRAKSCWPSQRDRAKDINLSVCIVCAATAREREREGGRKVKGKASVLRLM